MQLDEIHVKFITPDHWWQRTKWELLEDYTSHNGHITVPAGFVTDGASVPAWLWKWFSPVGKYFGASIVHDYIIVEEDDWERANKEFESELDALDITPWRKNLMMFAVRVWSKLKRLFK